MGQNQFSSNGLDIDLGADGPTPNDTPDRDSGPNELLNHPVLVDHTLEPSGRDNFRSTFRGKATPGSRVHIFERSSSGERRLTRSQPADPNGDWTVTISVIPNGVVRALATTGAGATSEFSPLFVPSQRVKLSAGVNWFAWTGPSMSVEQAISPLLRWVETLWVWNSSDRQWRGWSPLAPPVSARDHAALQEIETGDVLRLQLAPRAPRDFFVPSGGVLERPNRIELKQGFNNVTWLGRGVDSLDALETFDQTRPGLISIVRQWDGDSWELIWPRLRRAWDPGLWTFPALWIRAIRDGELLLP